MSPIYFIFNRIKVLKIFLILSYIMISLTMFLYIFLLLKILNNHRIQEYKFLISSFRELLRITQKIFFYPISGKNKNI